MNFGFLQLRLITRLTALAVLSLVSNFSLTAEVWVPSVFSDHMVLQRSSCTPVWGKGNPGETVIVKLGKEVRRTSVCSDGTWRVELDLSKMGFGPHALTIDGGKQIVFSDVLIGEVWIASGQSNMAQKLKHVTGGLEETQSAYNAKFRMFNYRVARPSLKPDDSLIGKWTVCDPTTAGDYSAVAYFHGRFLQEELQVPVGVVQISMGGTPAESWLSPEGLESDVDVKRRRGEMENRLKSYPGKLKAFAEELEDWLRQHNRTDRPVAAASVWKAPDYDDSGWQGITLPGVFSDHGLPDSGVVWLRKHVPVSSGMAGRELVLKLGDIRDYTKVYWNGIQVGETCPDTLPVNGERWTYRVPAALVQEGMAVLAVRVYSPVGGGELSASLSGSSFRVTADPNNSFFLPGRWKARMEYSLPRIDEEVKRVPRTPVEPPELKAVPGVLYNGHVVPVRGYGARGFIWYQGEANCGRAYQYRNTFPRLIADWRKQWGGAELPFLFCQLPGFGPKESEPGPSQWAELRESQALTERLVPSTAMAVLIDLGEEGDIHPRNKREVGRRLAMVALGNVYEREVGWKAAEMISAKAVDGIFRIELGPTYGGMEARRLPAMYRPRSIQPEYVPLIRRSPESDIEGLSICGPDRKWVWANGRIDGDSIVVWSGEVPNPVAVRYAWSDNPTCNLYSRGGLPVAPFRTDQFPLSTQKQTR